MIGETTGKIAVKTKLPAIPITAPRSIPAFIESDNLNNKIAGIAAAMLA